MVLVHKTHQTNQNFLYRPTRIPRPDGFDSRPKESEIQELYSLDTAPALQSMMGRNFTGLLDDQVRF